MTCSPRKTRDPTRRSRFLVGECALRQEDCNFSSKGRALRREDCILSSKDAHSDKKMAFSRRRMRAPKRRLRFLVGGRVLRPEGSVFSPENARFDEKIAFSRRRTRTPTRRWRSVVGGRTLRREGCVFSSENAYSDKKITASRRWPFLKDPWSAGSSSKVCALTSRERGVLSARVATSALQLRDSTTGSRPVSGSESASALARCSYPRRKHCPQ